MYHLVKHRLKYGKGIYSQSIYCLSCFLIQAFIKLEGHMPKYEEVKLSLGFSPFPVFSPNFHKISLNYFFD